MRHWFSFFILLFYLSFTCAEASLAKRSLLELLSSATNHIGRLSISREGVPSPEEEPRFIASATPSNYRGLESALEHMFPAGQPLATDWPYSFQGLVTKIEGIEWNLNPPTLVFHLALYNHQNQVITKKWLQTWSRSQNTIALTTDYFHIKPRMRSLQSAGQSPSLARLLTQQQIQFLQKYAAQNGALHLQAAWLGVLTWASHGYGFQEDSTNAKIQNAFQEFLRKYDIRLSERELSLFVSPYHYLAFTDGKLHPINTSFYSKTFLREMVHGSFTLGKLFLLNLGMNQQVTWHGEIRFPTYMDSEARAFADAYPLIGPAAYSVLSQEYRNLVERVSAERAYPEVKCEENLSR